MFYNFFPKIVRLWCNMEECDTTRQVTDNSKAVAVVIMRVHKYEMKIT